MMTQLRPMGKLFTELSLAIGALMIYRRESLESCLLYIFQPRARMDIYSPVFICRIV